MHQNSEHQVKALLNKAIGAGAEVGTFFLEHDAIFSVTGDGLWLLEVMHDSECFVGKAKSFKLGEQFERDFWVVEGVIAR